MSAMIQGYGQSESLRAQAAMNEKNAITADQDAKNTLLVSDVNEEAMRRKHAAQLGEQRAQIAESGSGIGGSNADVLETSAKNLEMDALNHRYQGILQNRALKIQAENYRAQAKMERSGAQTAMLGGIVGGFTQAYTAGIGR